MSYPGVLGSLIWAQFDGSLFPENWLFLKNNFINFFFTITPERMYPTQTLT